MLLLLVYVIAHFRHYAKEEYRFDPFVQVPTARVDTSILNKPGLFILCLGGSTTRGVELKPGEDYPAQLQLLLHQTYPDIPVTVFNAGIPWYTSRHSLINYVTYYRQFKPEIVLIKHGFNDLARSFSTPMFAWGAYKDDYSHYYGPAIRAAVQPTFEKQLLERFPSMFDVFVPKTRPQSYDFSAFVSIAAFKKNIVTLMEYISHDGGMPVLLGYPSYYKPDEDMDFYDRQITNLNRSLFLSENGDYPDFSTMRMAMDSLNRVIETLSDTHQTPFADASAMNSRRDYFFDDVHHTAAGARFFAGLVAETLRSKGVILEAWRRKQERLTPSGKKL